MSDLGRGARDVGRGFAFLNQHRSLWGWVIAPAVVTLVLMVALAIGVVQLVDPTVAWVVARLPGFLQGLVGSLLWLVMIVALGFGALLAFVAVVGIVAGPFNELLSEAVEARVTGGPAPRCSLAGFARGFVVGIAHGVRRLAIALLGFVLVFVLGFVPVIGTIVAVGLGFYFASRAVAYDCYDAVLARSACSYDAKLAYLAERRGRTLSLGATVTALLFVPGVNLVALGVGAVAATLARLDETRRAQLSIP